MAKSKEKDVQPEEELEEGQPEEKEEKKAKPKPKASKKKNQTEEFALKMENSQILKVIIETLSSIIDETEIRVTPSEFTISAMDPSRICLLKLSIKKAHFDEYACKTESKISVNLSDLDKILRRSAASDTIELTFHEDDQKIKIKMTRDESSRSRSFSLALLDAEFEEVPLGSLDKIEYPNTLTIEPEILVEAIKDAEIYGEILNMKTTEGQGIWFSCSGQIGEMNYELGLDELIDPEINEDCSAAYSLTFLKVILKIKAITEKLEVSLKSDHPLKMEFRLLEGGELKYWLAPRVEEEEYDEDMEEF